MRNSPHWRRAANLAVLVCALVTWDLYATTQAPAGRVAFPGAVRQVVAPGVAEDGREAVLIRAVSASEQASTRLSVELALPMRNFQDLRRRVARGEVISAAEMDEKYLPLPEDHAAVMEWAAAQGLATRPDNARLSVFATGTAQQLASTFQVSFARVAYRGGEYTSAVTPPSVPLDVAARLASVNGLQPHLQVRKAVRLPTERISVRAATATDSGYKPAQMAAAYGATGLTSTGRGEVIAIVIDAFPSRSDLVTFWADSGISRSTDSVTFVSVGDGPVTDDAVEATLDVQWSGAMAPDADIRVYGMTELSFSAISEACARIYDDIRAGMAIHQVGMSFGGLEYEIPASEIETISQRLATLASAGVAVFVSSGDGGSNPDPWTHSYDPGSLATPMYPASDPSVTGVGGSSLQLAEDGSVLSETAWSGSGGGISNTFKRPEWQGQFTSIGSRLVGDSRLVPDIAITADPEYGAYFIYHGEAMVVGGTSWSTPIWVGLCAVLNESRIGAGLGQLGFLSPRLYPLLGSDHLRDITEGTNGGYAAERGYDLCTGVGVPVVSRLLATWSGAAAITSPAPTMRVLPGQTATFSVIAAGVTPLSYRWERLPAGAASWQDLAGDSRYVGAETTDLSVTAVSMDMNGDQFRCVVSNRFGSDTSAPAAGLLVHAPWTVTTYAGRQGRNWTLDGSKETAQFAFPMAISADGAGSLYVIDSAYSNTSYRKISADGTVSTLADATDPAGGHPEAAVHPLNVAYDSHGNKFEAGATEHTVRMTAPGGSVTVFGQAGLSGHVDGQAAEARFSNPSALAVSPEGIVYVAEAGGRRLRRISADGTVSTLAGSGSYGAADGIGLDAQFAGMKGLAVDSDGRLFVSDGNTVRMVTPFGAVTTVAGGGTGQPSIDGAGEAVALSGPHGMTFDRAGNLFICDGGHAVIRKAYVTQAPEVIVQPADQARTVVQSASLGVAAGGFPALSYAWERLGAGEGAWLPLREDDKFSGTNSPVLSISPLSGEMSGDRFRCVVSNSYGTGTSAAATLTVRGTYWFTTAAQAVPTSYPVENALALAQAPSGAIYVSNAVDNTVGRLTSGGRIDIIAGTAGVAGAADGAGSAATFRGPTGMAVDPSGNVYVADYYNKAIRKIAADGTVSTLAGGTYGTADGVGRNAQFTGPQFIALHADGSLYVTDTFAHTIRRVSPEGVVTTFAGAPESGHVDGPRETARFSLPKGMAFDAAGNLFIADAGNASIRRIAVDGSVTTLPGTFGTKGAGAYGTGAGPGCVTVDGTGALIVTIPSAKLIQKIAVDGTVTTVAGGRADYGPEVGAGESIHLSSPLAVAVNAAGTVYVADGFSIRTGELLTSSVGFVSVEGAEVGMGGEVTLAATAPDLTGFYLQWKHNGIEIPGATGRTLQLKDLTALQAGMYTVTAWNYTGSVSSAPARLSVVSNSWLSNLSARAFVAPSLGAGNVLIAGFVAKGSAEKSVLVRGVGPTLSVYGVPNALRWPRLTLHSNGTALAGVVGWETELTPVFNALGAFPLTEGSADAAMLEPLAPASYTAIVEPDHADGIDGVALLELYDADGTAPGVRLVNVSARAYVGAGGNVLVGGFVIRGTTPKTVLIRGVGPTLATVGLDGALQKPLLSLYDSGEPAAEIAKNLGWANAPTRGASPVDAKVEKATLEAMTRVGAFPLGTSSEDSAMIVTLPPGSYTAQLSGADSGTGVALIEVYELE